MITKFIGCFSSSVIAASQIFNPPNNTLRMKFYEFSHCTDQALSPREVMWLTQGHTELSGLTKLNPGRSKPRKPGCSPSRWLENTGFVQSLAYKGVCVCVPWVCRVLVWGHVWPLWAHICDSSILITDGMGLKHSTVISHLCELRELKHLSLNFVIGRLVPSTQD
jgi:hypothetical protein